MFHSARIKLTVWYVLITMVVSILFSGSIFFILHRELMRNERRMQFRINAVHELHPEINPSFLPKRMPVENTEHAIALNLFYINVLILIMSSVAGYFLAGRTLRPIQAMVDQQNRFVADASHELRTPLTSLRTAIEVNLRDKKLDLKQAKTVLHENLYDVKKLQDLSEQLLALTMLRTNTNHVEDSVDLDDVIKKAVQQVANQAKEKDIVIEPSYTKLRVIGDSKRLTDMFVIFLDNAVKYSPRGTTVRVGMDKTDGYVEVVIKDQGIGIEKKDQHRIFERFYRSDVSRSKNDVNGYGLGLAIAHEIILAHHGTVHVESTPGKGTTFTIRLPVKK